MTGQELINKYKSTKWKEGRNPFLIAGNWTNPIYAVYNSFTEEELLKMSEKEINEAIDRASNPVINQAFLKTLFS